MNNKGIITIITIFLLAIGVQGKMTETSLPFRNVSVDEGLPHNTVNAFYKDRHGFLWIGTKEGLARFDGNLLVNFHSIVSDDVWAIDTLNGDTLLMTTVSGVKWFDTASQTAGDILGVPRVWFSSLCRMDSTTMLAGSEQGLYLITNHKIRRIPIGNMLGNSNHITGIIPDKDGKGFWFSTADGLGYLDRGLRATVYRQKPTGSRDNYFTSLVESDGSIYVGSYNKGLFRYDKHTRAFTHVDTGNANLIMSLDSDGERLYVGTNGRGLIIINPATGETNFALHNSSNHHSLASNVVTGLLSDISGIYVGTQFGGISYNSKAKSKFTFYRTPYFNSTDHNVRSIYFYSDGEMLLGTRAGIFQLKDGHLVHSIETTDFDSHLSSGIILYIGQANGRILVCSYGGGVKVYDRSTGRLSAFNNKEEYAQNGRIFHFTTDSQGHIWFASHEGIYETDAGGNLLRHISADNSTMRNDAVYWLTFDKKQRLWIASKFGLRILDPATGKMSGSLPGIPSELDVRYLYLDSHGDMWACSNRGVFCFNGKLELVRSFDADDILPENTVMSVIEEPRNIIRISTIHNIVNYNLADGSHEVFRKNSGIGTGDLNGNVTVNPIDRTVYWTNEEGLLMSPSCASGQESRRHSLPRITYVQIGDSVRMIPNATPREISLTEGESVRINLSHMDFRYPENEGFEYMLEGEDPDWIFLGGESRIAYHSLAPGEYTFKFRTPGSQGISSTRIMVKRHTWKLVLFWIGMFFLCATAVILVYWIRRLYRRIKDRTQIFTELNRNSRKSESEQDGQESQEVPVNPLMTRLLTLVEDQSIYLDSKLKLSDVAGMLDCKETELSKMLNSELSTNFTTFINTYRIKAVKKAMAEGELKRYTVTAIGLRYGYNSKMTFFRTFKSIEGKTPLEYCKEKGFVTKPEE